MPPCVVLLVLPPWHKWAPFFACFGGKTLEQWGVARYANLRPPPTLYTVSHRLSYPSRYLCPLGTNGTSSCFVRPQGSQTDERLLSCQFPPLPALCSRPVECISHSRSLIFIYSIGCVLGCFRYRKGCWGAFVS